MEVCQTTLGAVTRCTEKHEYITEDVMSVGRHWSDNLGWLQEEEEDDDDDERGNARMVSPLV